MSSSIRSLPFDRAGMWPRTVAAPSPERRSIGRVRKRDHYAERLRRIPDFRDLTRSEARLVARFVDEVVVDGRRVLTFGARERAAAGAAVPRLGPRLQRWPLEGLPVGPATLR